MTDFVQNGQEIEHVAPLVENELAVVASTMLMESSESVVPVVSQLLDYYTSPILKH